jgi:hypothetical protein
MRPVTTTRLVRELRLELSAMFFIAGIVLTIFPVGHYFVKAPNLPPILQDIDLRLGEWNVWLIVLGPLLLLSGGYYFIDTIRKRREFERLIDTDSKAKFVRNQDRIEFLAWLLGKQYHQRSERKKVEFNLK